MVFQFPVLGLRWSLAEFFFAWISDLLPGSSSCKKNPSELVGYLVVYHDLGIVINAGSRF